MCAKDDLVRRKGPLLISTQTPNHVDTFSLDFAFSFAAYYRLFADKLVYALSQFFLGNTDYPIRNIQQSLLDRVTVMLIIILVNKTQLLLILGDRLTPSTLLAGFIPTTKIRDPLLKSQVYYYCIGKLLLRKQCYLTICAILANYEEQVLLTSVKKNRYCMRCTKHYNFNIHVSLATDTLHLLLKGLVIKMLDFMQDMLDDIYPSTVVSLLFILKAPFALHFICAVCNLVTLAQYKNIRIYRALDSICTRANSEAYHITIVKQFYSMINKKDKVAANIAISNFTYAAAVFIHPSIKCWQSSSKRYNDPKHCDEELYLILIIINYTCYDKDRKHIAYIRAFSKVLLFNNNRQIDNTTRILSVPFKFYDLSTIIRPVHLILRDLPNSTTRTTMSYYVNNYIN
ncbi:hypothetical protein HBI27_213310 [Parastagonospora nodorum]|nr:hypothetical protein HBI27_213310 [Parastagonospora nodorum]